MSHALSAVPPRPHPPSTWDVAKDYLSSSGGAKAVLKFGAIIGDVGSLLASASLSPAPFFREADTLAELAGLPQTCVDLFSGAWSFVTDRSKISFGSLVDKVCAVAAPLIDIIKLIGTRCALLGAKVLANLSIVGNSAYLFLSAFAIYGEIEKFDEAAKKLALGSVGEKAHRAQQIHSSIEIAKHVHFIAMSVLGLASLFAGIVCPVFVMVALSIGALATTVIGHFYKKMVLEPELKLLKNLPGPSPIHNIRRQPTPAPV